MNRAAVRRSGNDDHVQQTRQGNYQSGRQETKMYCYARNDQARHGSDGRRKKGKGTAKEGGVTRRWADREICKTKEALKAKQSKHSVSEA